MFRRGRLEESWCRVSSGVSVSFRRSIHRHVTSLRRQELLLILLAIVLVAFYARNLLFARPDTIPGGIVNDLYVSGFFFANEWIKLIRTGFLPIGSFWFHIMYMGTPAAIFQGSLGDLPEAGLALLLASGAPLGVSVKLLIFGTLFLSLFTSYKYASFFTENEWGALLSAVGYTFSAYVYNEIFLGHLNLTVSLAIVPVALFAFERSWRNPTTRNSLLAGASLALLFFTEWYQTFFAALFLSLRLLFVLWFSPNLSSKRILKSALLSFGFFILLIFPFFYTFLVFYAVLPLGTQQPSLSANPAMFFVRTMAENQVYAVPYQYVGLSVLLMAFVSILVILFKKVRLRESNSFHVPNSDCVFFAFIAVIFALYSSGPNSLVNISEIVSRTVPFGSTFTVVGRAALYLYLGLAMCAALAVKPVQKTLASIQEGLPVKSALRRIRPSTLLPLLLTLLIFADLTLGFEPNSVQAYQPSPAYQFLANQSGMYRVVELPALWSISNFDATYIGHDIAGSTPPWIRSYPLRSGAWENLYRQFSTIGRESVNTTELSVDATTLGVRYVIVHTDPQFYERWGTLTSVNLQQAKQIQQNLVLSYDFRLVFHDYDIYVYENSHYDGLEFAVPGQLEITSYWDLEANRLPRSSILEAKWSDINTIVTSLETERNVLLVYSLPSMKGWSATIDGLLTPVKDIVGMITVPVSAGRHTVTLHFYYYEESLQLLVSFYVFVVAVLVATFYSTVTIRTLALVLLGYSGIFVPVSIVDMTTLGMQVALKGFTPFRIPILSLGLLAGVLGLTFSYRLKELTYLMKSISCYLGRIACLGSNS